MSMYSSMYNPICYNIEMSNECNRVAKDNELRKSVLGEALIIVTGCNVKSSDDTQRQRQSQYGACFELTSQILQHTSWVREGQTSMMVDSSDQTFFRIDFSNTSILPQHCLPLTSPTRKELIRQYKNQLVRLDHACYPNHHRAACADVYQDCDL